jgi:hypothetical protein
LDFQNLENSDSGNASGCGGGSSPRIFAVFLFAMMLL